MKLANIKIGKKLALLFGERNRWWSALAALVLWAIERHPEQRRAAADRADKMMSAQRVGSDLGVVNAVVGHITLSKHCETCHGTRTAAHRPNSAVWQGVPVL